MKVSQGPSESGGGREQRGRTGRWEVRTFDSRFGKLVHARGAGYRGGVCLVCESKIKKLTGKTRGGRNGASLRMSLNSVLMREVDATGKKLRRGMNGGKRGESNSRLWGGGKRRRGGRWWGRGGAGAAGVEKKCQGRSAASRIKMPC